jgi:aryl-alcohol dehydrogenase-like predicted oxidoreductase
MMTIPAQQRTQQTSAETIGSTEEYIGRWLKGKREQIILATKFGVPMSNRLNSGGGSRENIMRAIEGSLCRLQTDYNAIWYQLPHEPNPELAYR